MKIKNIIWGLFFILSGVAIIANYYGNFIQISMLSLVITIMLIPIIIMSIWHGHFSGVFFPIAILCIIYDQQLGITDLTPWPILMVATLLTIGLHIIFAKHGFVFINGVYNPDNPEHFGEIIDEEDNNVIDVRVQFGSSIKYVNAKDFKRGSFSCSFGALKVYFDNTTLDKDGARINIDASFSGIELYIPKNWEVIHGTNTTLAGLEEKNRSTPDGKNMLTITGNISFSGIEIIYI